MSIKRPNPAQQTVSVMQKNKHILEFDMMWCRIFYVCVSDSHMDDIRNSENEKLHSGTSYFLWASPPLGAQEN